MARLIHRYENASSVPHPNLLYFFVHQQNNQHEPIDFLRAINAQLLDRLNLRDTVPTDLKTLRNQFNQLWSRAVEAATPTKPLLLIVDGLDEMAPGQLTIADLLPPNLGPYVHVIVSSRPNPDPLQQVSVDHPFKDASARYLRTFKKAEVKALLEKNGSVPQLP